MEIRPDPGTHPLVAALASLAGTPAGDYLALLVANAPVIVFTLDADGRIQESQGRARDAIVARRGETVGRLAREVYADLPEVVEAVTRALTGERFATRLTVDGLVLNAVFEPKRGPDGRLNGTKGVAWPPVAPPTADTEPPEGPAESLAASGLTPMQAQVACWLANGARPGEIADRLFLSRSTIYTHIAGAKAALRFQRPGEIAHYGSLRGWHTLVDGAPDSPEQDS